MVENIDIFKSHSLKGLIQARQQVLAASPVAVRALPHGVTGFSGDDHLVPIRQEILFEDPAEVLLSTARLRPVIIGQIKVRNTVIECCKAELLHISIGARVAKIVPQPQ